MYCSALNREFLKIVGSPDQLQAFITSPANYGSKVESAILAKKVTILLIFLSVGLGLVCFFNITRIQLKKSCMYKGGED